MGNHKKKTEREAAEPLTIRQASIKALVLGSSYESEIEAEKHLQEIRDAWTTAGAVDPIFDLDGLLSMYNLSDSLRQNIEAYVTNIELGGHRFKPKINLDKNDKETDEEIREAIEIERYQEAEDARAEAEERGEDPESIELPEITDSEVQERKEAMRRQIRREMHKAWAWFKNCCKRPDNWITLREKKRIDEEVIGHACWEALRDDKGQLRRLVHVKAHTVLPLRDDNDRVLVERREYVSKFKTKILQEEILLRRYVQRLNGEEVYFKSLGDPRLVSCKSGKVYKDEKAMLAEEKDAQPATELIYFENYSPQTEAGMIRWTGWIPGILGNRSAAETNHAYFENHAIPNAMLMISGGQLNGDTIERLEDGFRLRFKGPQKAGRLLIAQASPGKGKSSRDEVVKNPEMEFINLSDFQRGDALFREYTKMNQDGTASSFRQPPILTGRIPSDLNRATAEAALQQGDDQVYHPYRQKFDYWVNDTLMFEIGCELIEFESRGPLKRNAEEVNKTSEIAGKYGAFTPNEIRQVLSQLLGEDFEPIEADWANVPLTLTLNGISGDGGQVDGEAAEQAVAAVRHLEAKVAAAQAALREAYGLHDGSMPSVSTPHDGHD